MNTPFIEYPTKMKKVARLLHDYNTMRHQYIKAALVSRAIEKHNLEGREARIKEILVHTGQHYKDNMSHFF